MSHAMAWKRPAKKSSRPRRAADSVQEHQRRQGGIAGGLVTEAAIPGFHGREMRHAGPPDKSDLPMLTGLRCLERNILYLKQFFDRATLAAADHPLASGGRKFTSCSAEMRTISATSVR